jgi:iron complex outermembrane receptor protein
MKHKMWIRGAMLAATFLSPLLASAQQAAAQASNPQGLEEIVVTAQFIEQNLQVTPVAITAVDAAGLELRGQVSVQQIAAQAPNVNLTEGGAFGGPSLIAFIRGVGQTDFNPALEPGVGLYVDDVYYSTLTGSVLDLLDLDRVEVLRGPQGTLSGKNSIGGAIKLFSKKPGDAADAYVEAAYGSFDEVDVRAASSFTLVPDRLWLRVSGVSRARDGFVTRLDYGCTHPGSALGAAFPTQVQGAGCTIGREGGIKYTGGRLAFRWVPTENLEFNFAADVMNEDSDPPANVLLGVGPTIAPVIVGGFMYPTVAFLPGFPPGVVPPFFPGVTNADGCNFIAYGSGSCDPASPNDPYVNYSTYVDPNNGLTVAPNQRVDSRGFALNIDWRLSENLQLQSITAYRRYDAGFALDSDATPYPMQNLYQSLDHNQTSQELRLNGKVGDRLDYTLGGFYFDQETPETGRIDLAYVGFDFIHGPDPVDDTNWAAFAHGIFHFMDNKMDLSLGVRYSDDEKTYTFARHNPDGSDIQPCIGPPGTPGNPPNCVISDVNGLSSTFQDNRTDYRAALSYSWTDALMTYLQYSTGYKGGGVNPRPFYTAQAVTFEPETLDALELGVKSQFLDNSLRVNVAVFTNNYKDILLTLNDCSALFPGFGIPCLAPVNAGDADVDGAELEFTWQPTGRLQMDGSYSYLDFSYSSLNYPTADTGVTLDHVTPYTPKTKWSFGVQYEMPLGGGTLTPRVDVNGQDKMYTDAPNTDLGTIDSYTLVNARLSWQNGDEDWVIALECRNLTDELYYTTKTNQVEAGAGSAYGAPGKPLTYLFSVRPTF